MSHGIDRLVHEPVRLDLLLLLARGPSTWQDARRELGTSDGNLSVHARRLEDAGYLAQHKSFVGRKPRTQLVLTDRGRAALQVWGDAMLSRVTELRP